MNLIREYIRLLLEEEILGEPDKSAEEEREHENHHDEQSSGGVPGPIVPLGTGSAEERKKRRKDAEKANASAFGGAKEL
jgi:hypothetical protein